MNALMTEEPDPQDSHQAGAAAAVNAAGKPPVDLLNDPLWKALLFMALPATIGTGSPANASAP